MSNGGTPYMLVACVSQQPDVTPGEPQQRLVAAGGPAASLSLLGIILVRHDARQKKSLHAIERDTERVKALWAAFLETLPGYSAISLRFMDEKSVNLTHCRCYRCTLGGGRVQQAGPLHAGPDVTVVEALVVTGLKAVRKMD